MPDLDYVTLVGRFGIVVGDGIDVDDEPDVIWCDEGEIRLVPLNGEVKIAGASPVPWTGGVAVIDATIDTDGYLSWRGKQFVQLVDLTSDKVNPTIPANKATHRVEFRNVKADSVPVSFTSATVRIAADTVDIATGTCDLTKLLPVQTGNPTPIYSGPRGTGVTDLVQPTPTTMALELTDGTTTDPIVLPVGPGGSDAGVAGYLTDPASASAVAVDAKQLSGLTDPGDVRDAADSRVFRQLQSVNALAAGIPGDGTDQTTAINALLAENDNVFFPPEGDYVVNGMLTPRSGQLITGVPGRTVIKFTTNGANQNNRVRMQNVSDVMIQGVKLTETGVTSREGAYGVIAGENCDRITLSDVEVDGGSSTSTHFINSRDITIRGGSFHDAQADGLHFQRGCKRVKVIGAHVYNAGDDCIGFVSHDYNSFGYCEDLIVIGCTLESTRAGAPGSGVAFIGAIGGIIANNTIRATALAGVRVTPYFHPTEGDAVVGNLIIRGNRIFDCGNYSGATSGVVKEGIYVTDARGVHIQGNHIRGSIASGITVAGAAIDVTIDGNQVDKAGARGIWLATAERTTAAYLKLWTESLFADGITKGYVLQHQVKVTGNVVRSPGTDGIYANASANRYIEDAVIENNQVYNANASAAGGTIYGLRAAFIHNSRVRNNHVGDAYPGATLTKISVGQRTLSIVEGNTPRQAADITYVGTTRHTTAGAVPTSGSWDLGDHVDNVNPQGGQIPFWKCKTAGTFGTLNSAATTGTTTAGSPILTVNSASGLTGGEYITIAGVTGRKKVIGVAGLAITLDSNADASVTGAAVAYGAPAFSAGGVLT